MRRPSVRTEQSAVDIHTLFQNISFAIALMNMFVFFFVFA